MINVLVVDDSAVVRESMKALLARCGDMTVTTASDPIIAMQKMRTSRPDVIILDIEMPRMDGLTFLRQVMTTDPLPIVVCSGLAGRGTEVALTALEEGAVDIITKPLMGIADFLQETRATTIEVVRAAAASRPGRQRARAKSAGTVPPPAKLHQITYTTERIIAVGASTGGTEALRVFLEAIPPAAPGIVIVQHMPEQFTAAFAKRLNETCAIEVKEAEDGDRISAGRALIAPGNRHLEVRRNGAQYVARLHDEAPVSRHRPSVDVLFRSVAAAAGKSAVGVIMTGMGSDGADGMAEIKRSGGVTIAQDEASCIVFGMPKEAIARGCVDHVCPLERLSGMALAHASRV